MPIASTQPARDDLSDQVNGQPPSEGSRHTAWKNHVVATVTFLFTDIESSTRRWEQDEPAMRKALEAHDALLREEIGRDGGSVFKHTGDGCIAVFTDAPPAVHAAISAQRRFTRGDVGLAVRMAVVTGPAEPRDGDWFGPVLNHGARILDAGHAGQVVVGDATASLVADRTKLVDLGEHSLRDIGRPARLWQVLADGLADTFPPLRTELVRGNLPIFRSALIGRNSDLREISDRLRTTRLLTVTGIGGSGKTRLAAAVAERCASRFPGGAWFVDLAPVNGDAAVAAAFCHGLAIAGASDTRRDLLAYLTSKTSLVVVDNCEHVLDTTAELVDAILDVAPGVTILATSREPLGLEGEVVWRASSLNPATAAVELFADRARLRQIGFTVDPTNRDTVVSICRALDGIPLAIELAAAQIGAFTTAQIADMIDERLTLLTGGRRRGRQATLAATMDWSYGLLVETERQALRRAAVLPGSFPIAAFAAVVNPTADSSATTTSAPALATLRALVDKSLIESDGNGRFRSLETVRVYGEERLVEAGDATMSRDALEAWIRRELEQAFDSERITVAIREIESLRAAISWSVARGESRQVTAYLSLAGVPLLQTMLLDDLATIVTVAERCDHDLDHDDRVLWRTLRGGALGSALIDASGWTWLEEAQRLDPDLETVGGALALMLYAIYLNIVDPPAARTAVDRGLAHPASMPPSLRIHFQVYDGIFELTDGNYAAAIEKLEPITRAAEAAGAHFQAHLARVAHATALDLHGEHHAAVDKACQALDHSLPRGWIQEPIALQALAVPTARLGDLDTARRLGRSMLSLARNEYAHIQAAIGPAVVTAGVILGIEGNTERALEVLSGAQTTLLAARSEMAWAIAKHEIAVQRDRDRERARDPLRRGRLISISDLARTAHEVLHAGPAD